MQDVKVAEDRVNSLSQTAGAMKMMICPAGFPSYLEVTMQKLLVSFM